MKSGMKKIRNIGLDVKKPKSVCDDKKCPWHGNLKVRGRIFRGNVVSVYGKTAIVQWNYYHHVPKYERYEKRKTRVAAFNPLCINAKVDDFVTIGECRPLSKLKRFVIIEKVRE